MMKSPVSTSSLTVKKTTAATGVIIPYKTKTGLDACIKLIKPSISALVAISAVATLIIAGHVSAISLAGLFSGVFFTAAAAGALNQIWERNLDKSLKRTASRPLPAGKLSTAAALVIAITLLISGLGILWGCCGWRPSILGAGATAVYLGIYTPLKKISAFAALPGAFIGAFPLAIGWSAGMRSLMDPGLAAISGFLILWQIPHFWLLLLIHYDDYQQYPLPALPKIWTPQQLAHSIFFTLILTVSCSLTIPLALDIPDPAVLMLLAVFGLAVLALSSPLLTKNPGLARFKHIFKFVTLYALAVMLTVMCNYFPLIHLLGM